MIEGIISRKTRLETLNPGTLPVVVGFNPPILPKQGFCLKTFVLGVCLERRYEYSSSSNVNSV